MVPHLMKIICLFVLFHIFSANGESVDTSAEVENSRLPRHDQPLISKDLAAYLFYRFGKYYGSKTVNSIIKRSANAAVDIGKRGIYKMWFNVIKAIIPRKVVQFFQLAPKDDPKKDNGKEKKKKVQNPTGSDEGSSKLGKLGELSLTMTYIFQIISNRFKVYLPRSLQTFWSEFLKFIGGVQDDAIDANSQFFFL